MKNSLLNLKKLQLLLVYLYPSALLTFSYVWVAESFSEIKIGSISLELFFVGFAALSPVFNLLANFIFFYFLSDEDLRKKQNKLAFKITSALPPVILMMSSIVLLGGVGTLFLGVDPEVVFPMANLLGLSSLLSILNNFVFLSKRWNVWGLGWLSFSSMIMLWPENIYLPFITYSVILMALVFKELPKNTFWPAIAYFLIKAKRHHLLSYALFERTLSALLVATFFWGYKIQYWLSFLFTEQLRNSDAQNFSKFFLALVPYFFGMTLYYWLILPRLEKQINYTMSAISKHSLAHFMKWRSLLVKQFLGNFTFLILFLILVSNWLPIICSVALNSNACPDVHELIGNSLMTFGFILLHFLAFLSKFRQTIVFVLAYILLMLVVSFFDPEKTLEPAFFNGFIGFWVILIFSQIYYQLLRIYRFIFTV